MEKIDFKKQEKSYYLPKDKPEIINIPTMNFITISGKGNPNTSPEFQNALELLYALSYTIKMSYKQEANPIENFYEYVVPPLESLWWTENPEDIKDKDKFCYKVMIRQPEFVDEKIFHWAKEQVDSKKKLNTAKAQLEQITDGLCVQMMHIGSFDEEEKTFAQMQDFLEENGYQKRKEIPSTHREIYLSDFRKTAPEKLKTVLRMKVEKL